MTRMPHLSPKMKNGLLLALLLVTLCVSGLMNQQRLEEASMAVAIPVARTAGSQSVLETFRTERDQAHQQDLAALQALLQQEDLDEKTRCDAAERIQALVDAREAQLAVEGALLESSLAPCVAVYARGSLTIVTEKTEITEADSAVVLSVASAHTDAEPGNVKIMTTN